MSEIKLRQVIVPYEVMARAQELVQQDGMAMDNALEIAKREAATAQAKGEPLKPTGASYLNEIRQIFRESEPKK